MSPRRVRRAPVPLIATFSILTILLALAASVVGAAPAGAHARFEALDIPATADVTILEGRIGLVVAKKDATAEGDPIQIFSPGGVRIDNADPLIDRDGARISVSIRSGDHQPGTYTVAFHVVSADSHIVRGSESFELRAASGYAGMNSMNAAPAATAGRVPLNRHGAPAWPALLLVAGIGGTLAYRRRAHLLAAVDAKFRPSAPVISLDLLPPPPPAPPVLDDHDLTGAAGPTWARLSSSEPVGASR